MKNSICKIYKCNGTGFFCNIIFQNFEFKVLITNYHVIDKKYIEDNKMIKISLNDEKEKKDIELNQRKIYFNDKYDITIIEIKNSDNINVNYLELDEKIFEDNSELYYENKSIYILHYPNQDKSSVSYGITKKIENGEINHLCSTQPGSSGSPILDLNNNKVIGIHKGSLKEKNINLGTLLRKPLEQFYKEMTIKTIDIREITLKTKSIEEKEEILRKLSKAKKIKRIYEKNVL
jgi:V8-like Glu-specific endopeptidase